MITQPKKNFSLAPLLPSGRGEAWMIGLTSLEIYNSVFITTEAKKFFCRSPEWVRPERDEVPKNTIEKTLDLSDFSPNYLRDETIGILSFETDKTVNKGKTGDGYAMFLMGYNKSVHQDLENYVRTAKIPKVDVMLI